MVLYAMYTGGSQMPERRRSVSSGSGLTVMVVCPSYKTMPGLAPLAFQT